MPFSTFHHFSRLPFELRQQIWEEACLPSGPLERGIQYLVLTADGLVPSPRNWAQTSKQDPSDLKNKSAYLIDGGLWNACKESRQVIEKHTHSEAWVHLRNEAIDEDESFNSYKPGWDSGTSAIHPATIEIEDDTEEWHMLAYPSQDIFCIKLDATMPIPEEIEDSWLYTFFSRNSDGYSCRPDNIAFEFDQSWMVDSEMRYRDMTREHSVRGYWALLVDGQLVYEPRRALWIIDKNAKWFERSPERDKIIYRDYDGDYVEVDWDDVPESTGDGASLSASAFFDKFWGANWFDLCGIYSGFGPEFIHCGYESNEEAYEFELKYRVKLLVRRDNQVKEPTLKCWDKCDDQGWCICQDEEGNWWD
ncbi:hypothetical protein FPOAC2_02525 [Fusarium poae]|uniref:hypothetical protein n=1 Tax=Fusarium poae TaxID=36050 RepID=UPI001CEB8F53|nr:hypothetical protein FPOAC1_002434 [Fusarium poae]KAG8676431.1 hypothetical protein FPOAC1_002434 [Fusarium poae]